MSVTLYMLIGIPCVGKSTWLQDRVQFSDQILSTDNIVEKIANSCNMTYSEAWSDLIKFAEKVMYNQLERLKTDKDITEIYWDQTNLNRSTRAKKLSKLPTDWKRVAVFFDHRGFEEEIFKRNQQRPGKVIPDNVLHGMMKNLEIPSHDEGFNEIEVKYVDVRD
jgi:predicted kinase